MAATFAAASARLRESAAADRWAAHCAAASARIAGGYSILCCIIFLSPPRCGRQKDSSIVLLSPPRCGRQKDSSIVLVKARAPSLFFTHSYIQPLAQGGLAARTEDAQGFFHMVMCLVHSALIADGERP